jgi:hypothetical protein
MPSRTSGFRTPFDHDDRLRDPRVVDLTLCAGAGLQVIGRHAIGSLYAFHILLLLHSVVSRAIPRSLAEAIRTPNGHQTVFSAGFASNRAEFGMP